MSRALVIGSEGNLGRPLVRRLREEGLEVLEADIRPGWREGYVQADINQPLDLLRAFDWRPDYVLMLSALVSRVTCEQASSLAVATNLGGLNHVVQLCKRDNVKLVYFSTSEVYGPDCDPMDEAEPHPAPNNRYGLTKLLGERLVEYEAREYGLPAVTLRPFMVYDEWEEFGNHRSAMIRFAHGLATGQPVDVHRGTARSWLHITDAVAAIRAAMDHPDYAVINIGHPDVVATEELARRLCAELAADPALLSVTDLPERMTAVKRPRLDRMTELLGVTPRVGVDEGVARVCATTQERLAAAYPSR